MFSQKSTWRYKTVPRYLDVSEVDHQVEPAVLTEAHRNNRNNSLTKWVIWSGPRTVRENSKNTISPTLDSAPFCPQRWMWTEKRGGKKSIRGGERLSGLYAHKPKASSPAPLVPICLRPRLKIHELKTPKHLHQRWKQHFSFLFIYFFTAEWV